MDLLLKRGKDSGLTPGEVTAALRNGRPLSESNWCIATDLKKQSLPQALESFEQGRYLEYQCYEDDGREQGRSLLVLRTWEDQAMGLFTGDHVRASDAYYEWYMNHDVKDKAVYHVCQGAARHCKQKLARGDRRVLIHVDKWRLQSPQVMLETDYLKDLGMTRGIEAVDEAVKDKNGEAQRLAIAGTGLDAAMDAGKRDFPPDPPGQQEKKEKEKKRSRSPMGSKKPKGLAAHLASQEEKKKAALKDSKSKGKKKKKKRSKKKGRKESSSESVSSGSYSDSSGSLFHDASARGGVELWKLAKKKPGRLTEAALKEMSRYLAGQHELGAESEGWQGQRVLAYLNQIVFSNHPPSKIGVRAHRELITLGTCIDYLLTSQTLQCLDVLMQRLKAVELSIQDGNWNLARHFELIPPSAAQLSQEAERSLAHKAEMRRLKLSEAVAKAGKNK